MQVRLYAVFMDTGLKDPKSGAALRILLDIATARSGAEEVLARFPGSVIEKLIATPEGTNRGP